MKKGKAKAIVSVAAAAVLVAALLVSVFAFGPFSASAANKTVQTWDMTSGMTVKDGAYNYPGVDNSGSNKYVYKGDISEGKPDIVYTGRNTGAGIVVWNMSADTGAEIRQNDKKATPFVNFKLAEDIKAGEQYTATITMRAQINTKDVWFDGSWMALLYSPKPIVHLTDTTFSNDEVVTIQENSTLYKIQDPSDGHKMNSADQTVRDWNFTFVADKDYAAGGYLTFSLKYNEGVIRVMGAKLTKYVIDPITSYDWDFTKLQDSRVPTGITQPENVKFISSTDDMIISSMHGSCWNGYWKEGNTVFARTDAGNYKKLVFTENYKLDGYLAGGYNYSFKLGVKLGESKWFDNNSVRLYYSSTPIIPTSSSDPDVSGAQLLCELHPKAAPVDFNPEFTFSLDENLPAGGYLVVRFNGLYNDAFSVTISSASLRGEKIPPIQSQTWNFSGWKQTDYDKANSLKKLENGDQTILASGTTGTWSWWQSGSGALHYTSGQWYKPEVRINFKVNGILGAGMEYVMSVGIRNENKDKLYIDGSTVSIYYLKSPVIFETQSAPELPAGAVKLSDAWVKPCPQDDTKTLLTFTPTEDLTNGYIYLAFNGQYDNPEGNNFDVYSAELSVPHTATFKNGDAVVSTVKVVTVTAPDAVSIDGFQFVGWADANDHSKLYKAGSKIKLTEDATFVAAGIDVDSNYGASLRWSTNDAKRGLRFTTVVRSNLGGADETNKLVSPAQVKTLITDANGTVKEVLNSSTEGGNSRWAVESTATDLCWHGSVTEFAGKAEEVLTRNFHAQGVVVVNYADNTSAEISGTVSADANMKDIAQDVYEQNPYANGTSVKNVLKEVYNVG